MKSWLFVALALVMALSCERSANIVKAYRPRIEAQLERIRTAVKAADAQPNPRPPVLAEKLAFGANALLVLREAVKDPPERATHDLLAARDPVEIVRGALASPTDRPAALRATFDRFLAVRYLAVVSTYSFDGAAWAGAIQILDLQQGTSAGTLVTEAHAADATALYGEAKRAIAAALAPLMAPGTTAF